MPILSDSEAANCIEFLVSQETDTIELGPLMYAAGAWPDSVEIYVNGLLQSMVGQYNADSRRVILIQSVLPGDTVRVVALENIE